MADSDQPEYAFLPSNGPLRIFLFFLAALPVKKQLPHSKRCKGSKFGELYGICTMMGLFVSHDVHECHKPGKGLIGADDWLEIGTGFRLSRRELAVAKLIFEGNTRSQITRKLGCAPGTARVYIDRLYAKLKVRDRVALVLRIVRAHLLKRAE